MEERRKEDFLELLKKVYPGPGSVEEGSFAGDILRACADVLAELYSVEIDGLARRAFVSTAQGEWLTAVCADRGVERGEGESDESLRARTLEVLAALPASGNADHYCAWVQQAGGILRSRVLSCVRGNGTVDVVTVGMDGRAPSDFVLTNAQAEVDAKRPVGVNALVRAGEEVPVDIAATVWLTKDGDLDSVMIAFRTALKEYLREHALAQTTLSYAKLLGLLLDCQGVADAENFTVNGVMSSLVLEEWEIPVVNEVAMKEGKR